MKIKSILKKKILPKAPNYFRLPFGLGRGIVMFINFDHQTRLYLGLYEKEISHYVRDLLSKSSACFDIGANTGYYSLICAKLTQGRVLAVEPDKKNHSALLDNQWSQ